LECVIVTYAATALIVIGGGFDLGWIRATALGKPLLILILAVPTRLALQVPLQLPLPRLPTGVARRLVPAVLHLPASVRDALVAILITRPPTIAASFLLNILVPPRGYRQFDLPFEHQKWAEIFTAWDSGWYFAIAKHGYTYAADGQTSVAFFPLYPMAMRILAWPFGASDRALWLAGILISWSSLFVSLVILHRFTMRLFGDREVARRAVLYLAVFPFSFFFSRVYTESLFLLTSMAAVMAAYDKRWWAAGMLGALAALTRPNGVLVAVPLLCLVWMDRADRRHLIRRILAVSLVPGGLGLYCLFLFWLTGNPLAWLDAQRHWLYSLGHAPWEQLLKLVNSLVKYGPYHFFFTSRLAPYQFFHGTVALILLAFTPAVFRYAGAPLGMYVLVSLLVPLTGSDLQGIGRYASVLFPVFMVAGRLAGKLHEPLLITCVVFRTLFGGLFVLLHPIF
jgi:hypothetical protein